MFKLLPHYFKKIGCIITPIGFLLWAIMQLGWVSEISESIDVRDATLLNIIVAVLGLLLFLFGIYSILFSKEKVEDEMINIVRLESFRLAALVQIVLIGIGLIIVGIMKNPPKDAGMMVFFMFSILIFWISYIIRFNYIIHFRVFKYDK